MANRPLGIAGLSVFTAVIGVASFVTGIAGTSLVLLVIGVVQLVAAYGLWRLHPVGGVFTAGVYLFDALRKANDVLAGEQMAAGGMLLNAAIVAYLYLNREVFRKE